MRTIGSNYPWQILHRPTQIACNWSNRQIIKNAQPQNQTGPNQTKLNQTKMNPAGIDTSDVTLSTSFKIKIAASRDMLYLLSSAIIRSFVCSSGRLSLKKLSSSSIDDRVALQMGPIRTGKSVWQRRWWSHPPQRRLYFSANGPHCLFFEGIDVDRYVDHAPHIVDHSWIHLPTARHPSALSGELISYHHFQYLFLQLFGEFSLNSSDALKLGYFPSILTIY